MSHQPRKRKIFAAIVINPTKEIVPQKSKIKQKTTFSKKFLSSSFIVQKRFAPLSGGVSAMQAKRLLVACLLVRSEGFG